MDRISESFYPRSRALSIKDPNELSMEIFTIIHERARVRARSQARIISGLKSFFTYLIFEDYRTDNPM